MTANKAEFDKFGSDYVDILNRDVSASGESAEYFADYKAECVRRWLGDGFEGDILDYGCGVGLVTRALRKRFDGGSVGLSGFDVSPESIKAAAGDSEGIGFFSDPGDLDGKVFDALVVANVLHHVPPGERPFFMGKAARMLKEGGLIFIFEHNPYNPMTRNVVRASELDRDAVLLRAKEAEGLLKGGGLKVMATRYIVFFPAGLKALRPFEPVMGRIPVGAQYMCVGKVSR